MALWESIGAFSPDGLCVCLFSLASFLLLLFELLKSETPILFCVALYIYFFPDLFTIFIYIFLYITVFDVD